MINRRMTGLLKRAKVALFLSLAAADPLPAATANVSVEFVDPEHYADVELDGRGTKAREGALKEIRSHLESLAGRYLKPNQTLRIDVLDVDLAGRLEWWHAPLNDTRYFREVTWPRIELAYELREGEKTILSATEKLSDRNYLMQPQLRSSVDPLEYDKAMLDDWFRARFAASAPDR